MTYLESCFSGPTPMEAVIILAILGVAATIVITGVVTILKFIWKLFK